MERLVTLSQRVTPPLDKLKRLCMLFKYRGKGLFGCQDRAAAMFIDAIVGSEIPLFTAYNNTKGIVIRLSKDRWLCAGEMKDAPPLCRSAVTPEALLEYLNANRATIDAHVTIL